MQRLFTLHWKKCARKAIGDNPINDIREARREINAVTLQKIHEDTPLGTGESAPDAAFKHFGELRRLLVRLREHT